MTTPAMLWTGRVLTGLFALFMLGASIAPKLLQLPIAEETMAELGWPSGYAFMIGLIELTCLVLYLIPRTSLLGAVLMMGLLGGAMATRSGWAIRFSATSCSAFTSGCSCGAGFGSATDAFRLCFPSCGSPPMRRLQRDRRRRRSLRIKLRARQKMRPATLSSVSGPVAIGPNRSHPRACGAGWLLPLLFPVQQGRLFLRARDRDPEILILAEDKRRPWRARGTATRPISRFFVHRPPECALKCQSTASPLG